MLNSKHEIRNSKQTKKIRNSNALNKRDMFYYVFLPFGFRICLGFRYSIFGFKLRHNLATLPFLNFRLLTYEFPHTWTFSLSPSAWRRYSMACQHLSPRNFRIRGGSRWENSLYRHSWHTVTVTL